MKHAKFDILGFFFFKVCHVSFHESRLIILLQTGDVRHMLWLKSSPILTPMSVYSSVLVASEIF